jgi:hypothetical protein
MVPDFVFSRSITNISLVEILAAVVDLAELKFIKGLGTRA